MGKKIFTILRSKILFIQTYVFFQGEILPPAPPPQLDAVAAPKPAAVGIAPPAPVDPFKKKLNTSLTYTAGLGSILGLGLASPNAAFTTMVTTFGLAGIVGKFVKWPKPVFTGMIKFRINQDFLIEHSCILHIRSSLLLL